MVIEGVEGAGKSTQIQALSRWMEALGIAFVATREPGGTVVGERIRDVLLDAGDVPPLTELLLMLGARAAFVAEVVRPALSQGKVVLADRYALSTFAYQGHGRGLDLERVREANALATGGLEPDLYLVLDAPARVGIERQRALGKRPDRFESAGVDFLDRVAGGYRHETARMPHAARIDGTLPEAEVTASLQAELRARWPETFGGKRD